MRSTSLLQPSTSSPSSCSSTKKCTRIFLSLSTLYRAWTTYRTLRQRTSHIAFSTYSYVKYTAIWPSKSKTFLSTRFTSLNLKLLRLSASHSAQDHFKSPRVLAPCYKTTHVCPTIALQTLLGFLQARFLRSNTYTACYLHCSPCFGEVCIYISYVYL